MIQKEVDGHERSEVDELLLRVSWFYYKDEMTQDEIATRLSVSRASVGRMLDRARKVGLVSIQLNTDHLDSMELNRQLREAFSLSDAHVVPDFDGEDTNQHAINARVGLGGAQFLGTHLRRELKLGIGFGETVSKVVSVSNFHAMGRMHFVTLTGGVDGYLHPVMSSRPNPADPGPIAAAVIPSPIVTSTADLASALKAEPTVARVLEQARAVDLAIVGVGTANPDATIVQMGYLTESDVEMLRESAVVGDILGQYFDASGHVVDIPLHDRRIGIELVELKNIPKVIGVAGGMHKIDAILGALRGNYLDVLVTNETVARELLARG